MKPKLAELVDTIERGYEYLMPLATLAKKGVAYHNATIPQKIRYLIEDAVKEKSIDVVAATTTLAEGVDLPFRNTVIVDWLLYRNGKEGPMPALLFRNIAGRCGRAGVFTEGDTIIFDNLLGSFEYTSPGVRDQSRDQLLAEPKPLQSMLTSDLAAEQRRPMEAVLESQFVAAIAENANDDDLSGEFARATFGAFTGSGNEIGEMVGAIRDRMLDPNQPFVFARAASPIQLTELGIDANTSGFSPISCVRILSVLSSISPLEPVDLLAHLIRSLSDLPEQQNETWRARMTNPRKKLMVGPDDLEFVIGKWLSGEKYADIFVGLPAVGRSSRKPSVEIWISGEPAETWSEEYDKFLDFLSSVFERFLPWLLYACSLLARHAGSPASMVDWKMLRARVSDRAARSELGLQTDV